MSFTISQFSAIFHLRNKEGKPYILIGGQAVNFWAESFLKDEPTLSELLPFTSQDIDFKGSRKDAKWIAIQLKSQATLPSMAEMTALAGLIPFQIGSLKSNIEIVSDV